MTETTQLDFGGLRSSVVVDGSDAPQYGVQQDEGTMEVSSWIVSEPDTPFAIHWEVMNRIPGENYAVHIFLDGNKASGAVVGPQDSPFFHAASFRVSHTETRMFMFGSLELSDDDALLEASSAQTLGEIRILFYKVGSLVLSNDANYSLAPQAQKVHERAKKGLSHSVKYGGTQLDPLEPTTQYFTCFNTTLIASHIIRYRPLAMLQANGIVPYDPANDQQNVSEPPIPIPGPSSRNAKKRKAPQEVDGADVKPVIDLTGDYQDIDGEEDELKKSKAQHQGRHQGRQAKKVKQERKPIISGEVIDLTI